MNSKIFKSYDVRGVYGSELTEEITFRIGRSIVRVLGAKSIVIARDHRASSPTLYRALAHGILHEGGKVITLGIANTPMLYFASAKLTVDAGVMITASHNPPEYNGIKICKKNAVPVGLSSGLDAIRDDALSLPEVQFDLDKEPKVRETDITKAYTTFLTSFAQTGKKRFHIVTDTANALGILELPILHKLRHVTITKELYTHLGSPSPHIADPSKTETLIELQHAVTSSRSDIGIAYDGDADRVGFVDEKGNVVSPDIITAILSRYILQKHPKCTILYDLRSSDVVKEEIERHQGKAIESMVGHANIKAMMHREKAKFAGELTAHYYFHEGGYIAEMGSLPVIILLNILEQSEKTLSELVKEVRKYHHTGEINFHVRDSYHLFEELRIRYGAAKISDLDGLKFHFPTWWFSIRSSNTEPVVRLNLESKTHSEMELRRQELTLFIQRFS